MTGGGGVMLAKASIQEKQFRFLGTLTPRQNKDSLPWMPDQVGHDGRGGRHACESEHPGKTIPLFRGVNTSHK